MNFVEQMIKTFGQPPELYTFKYKGGEIEVYVKKLTLYENDRVLEKVGEMPKFDKMIEVTTWKAGVDREITKLCLVDTNGALLIKKESDFTELCKKLGRNVVNELVAFVVQIATDADKKPEKQDGEEQDASAEGGEKKD